MSDSEQKPKQKRGPRVGWHVRLLPDGKYQARAWDPHERRKKSQRFSTEAEAARWAKHEHSRLDAGVAQAGRAPVAQLIDDYIKDRTRTCSSTDHVDEAQRVLLAALAAGVTDLRTERCTAAAERFLSNARALHRNGADGFPARLAPRTLNSYLDKLQAFGRWAVRRRHVLHNPFSAIERVAEPQDLKATFQLDEMAKLVDPSNKAHRYFPTFLAMAYLGLREGEAVNMRWSWHNWSEGIVKVTRSAGWRLKRQKERLVPIPREYRVAMKPFADAAQLEGRRDDHVNPWLVCRNRKTRQKRFDEYLLDCGVPVADRTPHSARHTWVSVKIASGESDLFVMLAAGHDKPETTAGYGRSAMQYRGAVQSWQRGELRFRVTKKRPKRLQSPRAVMPLASR